MLWNYISYENDELKCVTLPKQYCISATMMVNFDEYDATKEKQLNCLGHVTKEL